MKIGKGFATCVALGVMSFGACSEKERGYSSLCEGAAGCDDSEGGAGPSEAGGGANDAGQPATPDGGEPGSGGVSTSGGAPTNGGEAAGGGMAGAPIDAAGMTSTGGMLPAAGAPNAAGDGGAAGAPVDGPITVDELAGTKNNYGFAWKDSWFIVGCVSAQNWDCAPVPNCDPGSGGYIFKEEFKVGGTLGKTYEVTIKVNGITEGKTYRNGMRRRVSDDDMLNPGGGDALYIGGEPIPGNYNAYEIGVYLPDGTTKVQNYFLNSTVDGSAFDEHHRTIAVGYEFKADVPGAGVVKYTTIDSNCKTINNCGPDELTGADCSSPRNVPNEPGLVVPTMYGGLSVASLNPAGGAAQPFHAHLIHVTVKGVVEKL